MSEFAVSRPITIIMMSVGLVVLGLISASRTPTQLLPNIVSPEFSVITNFRGASPEEIEEKVSKPIEEVVSTTGGLYQVLSYSDAEQSTIQLKFTSSTNIVQTISDIREKIDSIGFEDGVGKPKIARFNPSSLPILRVAVQPSPNSSLVFSEMADVLRDALVNKLDLLDGVAVAELKGVPRKEIHIQVDPLRATAFGIEVASIPQIITGVNRDFSGGSISENGTKMAVRFQNKLRSIEELGQTTVKKDPLGQRIMLRDIARIESLVREPVVRASLNASPALIIDVKKESDANALEVATTSKATIDEFLSKNRDFVATTLVNQGDEIKASVDDVVDNVLSGGMLAAVIIFIFLRSFGPTLIVCLSIPMSIAMTLTLMYATGVTFNLMSLGGLALGVGMLMDNSISVLENITVHKNRFNDIKQAVIWGTREVAGSIVASTLCTVCVFAPLVLVEGMLGQLFKDISLTVVYSISSSLVVGLLLIPCLSSIDVKSHLKSGSNEREAISDFDLIRLSAIQFSELNKSISGYRFLWPLFYFKKMVVVTHVAALLLLRRCFVVVGKFLWKSSIIGDKIHGFTLQPVMDAVAHVLGKMMLSYERGLNNVLAHKGLVVVSVVGLLGLGIVGLAFKGAELFPEDQASRLTYVIDFRPGQSQKESAVILSEIESRVKNLQLVKYTSTLFGDKGSATATLLVELDISTPDQSRAVTKAIYNSFAVVPDIVVKKESGSMISSSKPVELVVFNDNLKQLERNAKKMFTVALGAKELKDVETSLKPKVEQVLVKFDKQRLDRVGAQTANFTDSLQGLAVGVQSGALSLANEQVPIFMSAQPTYFNSLNKLKYFFGSGFEDRPVTLNQVADLKVDSSLSRILRIDRKRVAVVSADLNDSDLGAAKRSIASKLKDEKDFKWEFGGQDIEQKKSERSLFAAIALSLFLIYILLASQFESFKQPIIILVAAPLSIVGVAAALYVTNSKISALVLVGFVILIGMTVNTSIVLVDTINQQMTSGNSRLEAIVQACKSRLTPILMNALSNVIGLVPMAIGVGQGAGMRQPLAITIIGGMVSSTILALFLIPVVYDFMKGGSSARTS